MTCRHCGKELEEDARFCAGCGKPVEEPETEQMPEGAAEPVAAQEPEPEPAPVSRPEDGPEETGDEEPLPGGDWVPPAESDVFVPLEAEGFDSGDGGPPKKNRLPVIVLAGVALVAVIIAAVALFGGRSGNALWEPLPKDRLVAVSDGESETIYLAEGEILYAGDNIAGRKTTLDRRAMAVLNDDDTLFWADGAGITRIDDDVEEWELALNGGAVLYLKAPNSAGMGDLYRYDAAQGESAKLVDSVYLYCLSPDGKTYAYMRYDEDGEEFITYLVAEGGEPRSIDREFAVPLAVTDGGDMLYYVQIKDSEANLYVWTEEEDLKLIGDMDNGNTVYVTADLRELLFTRDGSTYISRDGTDRKKVVNEEFSGLVNYPGTSQWSYVGTQIIFVEGIDTFNGRMVFGDETVYLLGEEESTVVTTKATRYNTYCSADGKKLIYLDERDRLFILGDVTDEGGSPELLMQDVGYFTANPDLSQIYVIDEEDTLYSLTPGGEPEQVAYDIEDIYYNENTEIWYFVTDEGELLTCRFGKEPERVRVPDEVYFLSPVGDGVYVYLGSYSDYDIYYLEDPQEPLIPVMEDARLYN